MRPTLYTEIREALESSDTIGLKIAKGLRWVRLFNNQLENENIEKPYNMPAVFLSFEDIAYLPLGAGVEQYDVTVKARIVFESYKDEDIDILTFVEKIDKVMKGVNLTGHTPLTRTAGEPDFDHDNRIVHIVGYATKGQINNNYVNGDKRTVTGTALELTKDLDL